MTLRLLLITQRLLGLLAPSEDFGTNHLCYVFKADLCEFASLLRRALNLLYAMIIVLDVKKTTTFIESLLGYIIVTFDLTVSGDARALHG